jgi:PBP superfamily domain
MPSAAQHNGIGVCVNEKCEHARRRQPIEYYPGPGQYCPECGELLSPVSELGPEALESEALESEALESEELEPEALEPEVARESEAPSEECSEPQRGPEPRPFPLFDGLPHDRARHLVLIACGAIAVMAIAAVAGATQIIPALGVRVCTSTMTDGIAKEVVDTYASQNSTWPYHYTVTPPGDLACDVRFFAAGAGHDESVIARDGVVAVVNPQNPISQLDASQVRDVFAGRIVNWSQLGGHPGEIAAAVPGAGSDEAHAFEDRMMFDRPLGSRINRTLSAAQIVRWVASPSGARSIGIVPFSAALPAKVVTIAGSPAPSSLSIADEHYPLSVRILAGSDFRQPSRPAEGLVSFAHSALANKLLLRAALITPSGS